MDREIPLQSIVVVPRLTKNDPHQLIGLDREGMVWHRTGVEDWKRVPNPKQPEPELQSNFDVVVEPHFKGAKTYKAPAEPSYSEEEEFLNGTTGSNKGI